MDTKIGRLCLTAKVHKKLLKSRPIICCCGINLNNLSHWLDYKLKKLPTLVPIFTRDSMQIMRELLRLNVYHKMQDSSQ